MSLKIFALCAMISTSSSSILHQIGRLYIPESGFSGAENVAVVTDINQLFTADGSNIGLNALTFDINSGDGSLESYTANIIFEQTILFENDFIIDTGINGIDDVTSVEYSPYGYLAVCIVPNQFWINNGYLAIVNALTKEIISFINLPNCFLPDHVTITDDGNYIVISCEGEPDDNEAEFPQFNPVGSVVLIDTTPDVVDPNMWIVTNIGFEAFNEGGIKNNDLPNDIYLPHSDATVSQNLEPEYATCDYLNQYCYVVLQENNAIAILNIERKIFENIYTLGVKDYSKYGIDASDKDNTINIQTYNNLYGLRMPDNIQYFQSLNGREFITMANEGDSKDFDESRVKDITLDPIVFPNANTLQDDAVLGRLKIINQLGLSDDGMSFDELYAFNSRDFSIFEIIKGTDGSGASIEEVFSSDSDFETITASVIGIDGFNSNYGNPSFDSRSDDKGPEPECITVGQCNNGKTFVFIGLERVGGIMVYDATNIDDPDNIVSFMEYENNRNFSILYDNDVRAPENAGDVGPEQLRFIDENVYGVPLLIVANAESASVTIYTVNCSDSLIDFTNQPTEEPTQQPYFG